MTAFAPLLFPITLYPVVDSVKWIERLLAQGVTTIQLRIKAQPASQIEATIAQAVAIARRYRCQLFINDYWQLAIKYQAFGVHLGQEDIEIADLDAIRQAGLRLGISTHDWQEVQRVLAVKPSYLALGHIFATQSKKMPSKPQGLLNLKRQLDRLAGSIPTVAIGGINLSNIEAVQATGVGGIALISAITQAADWQGACQRLLANWREQESHNA